MPDIQHKNIGPANIHAPHAWRIANQADRLALPVLAEDIGKYAWQANDNTEWMLLSAAPSTWMQRGAQGAAGLVGYTHTQTTASATWTVAHNLARYPSVTVVNNLGQRIEPDVTYLDASMLQITHGTAISGAAYLN